MNLCKHQHIKTLTFQSPRFHDKKVLIGAYHIKKRVPHYKIVFTATAQDGQPYYPEPLYISRKSIVRHKKEDFRSIPCYAVPIDKLEKLTITAPCEHDWR